MLSCILSNVVSILSTLRTSFTCRGNTTEFILSIFLPSSTKIHIFAWSGSHWSTPILTICLYRRTEKYMHIHLSLTGISFTSSNTASVSKSRAHSQLQFLHLTNEFTPSSSCMFPLIYTPAIILPLCNITLNAHSQPHLHRWSSVLESMLRYWTEQHYTRASTATSLPWFSKISRAL